MRKSGMHNGDATPSSTTRSHLSKRLLYSSSRIFLSQNVLNYAEISGRDLLTSHHTSHDYKASDDCKAVESFPTKLDTKTLEWSRALQRNFPSS